MSVDNSIYKMFYFFLIAYAIYSCISSCRHRRTSSDDGNNNNNSNNNNSESPGNNEDGTDGAEKRRELIRKNLEFRTILASGKASEPIERSEIEPAATAAANNNNNNDLEEGRLSFDNINRTLLARFNDLEEERLPFDNINRTSLTQLTEMGFHRNSSLKALNAVGGSDTEAAMDWIFDHNRDPDLEDDIPMPGAANQKRSSSIAVGNGTADDDGDGDDDENNDDAKMTKADSVRSFLTAGISFFNTKMGGGVDSKREEEVCSICLEAYKAGDIVARLKSNGEETADHHDHNNDNDHDHSNECHHWFHEDCIMEWLQNHDECPLCRVDMIHPQ